MKVLKPGVKKEDRKEDRKENGKEDRKENGKPSVKFEIMKKPIAY